MTRPIPVLLACVCFCRLALHFPPQILDIVGVSSCCRVNKIVTVIHSQVLETHCTQQVILVGIPAVTNSSGTWCDVLNYYRLNCGLITPVFLKGHQKCISGLMADPTKNPLAFHQSTSAIFPLPEFSFVNLHYHSQPLTLRLFYTRQQGR